MSHTSRVRTKMTDLEIVKGALTRLGVPYFEHVHIKLWSEEIAVPLAVGCCVEHPLAPADYRPTNGIGFECHDGAWSLVGDFYCVLRNASKASMDAMADTWNNDGGNPNRLAQAYGLVTGYGYAEAFGCVVSEHALPNGDIELQLREGHLPPGTHISVLARQDGECSVSAWNFAGRTCRQFTDPLMAALGVVEEDLDKVDHNHALVGSAVAHVG